MYTCGSETLSGTILFRAFVQAFWKSEGFEVCYYYCFFFRLKHFFPSFTGLTSTIKVSIERSFFFKSTFLKSICGLGFDVGSRKKTKCANFLIFPDLQIRVVKKTTRVIFLKVHYILNCTPLEEETVKTLFESLHKEFDKPKNPKIMPCKRYIWKMEILFFSNYRFSNYHQLFLRDVSTFGGAFL